MTVTAGSLCYAIIIGLIFYCLKGNFRKCLLTVASISYIFFLDVLSGAAAVIVGLLTYIFGIWIGKNKGKKASVLITGFAVVLCVFSLLILKYLPRFDAFSFLIIPVGYSFYIFQVISYLVDIKREKTAPGNNIADVILYLIWFPKFVSGPILRFDDFAGEIKKLDKASIKDFQRFKRALYFVLFGFFMKIVIADRLSLPVEKIFEGYKSLGTLWLILGAFLYTMQIYCDFAGYSYVALGVSLMFGIGIVKNFDMPYCSQNITEFWRRWHMSLSSFLRDYLYIPLGGNRKGKFRKIINTIIVFFVCGMWHGSGMNFIAWGLLHGLFSAIDSICKDKEIQALRKGEAGRLITFLEASFAWIFFRATSFSSAVSYVGSMLTHVKGYGSFIYQMDRLDMVVPEFVIVCILLILTVVLDRIAYFHNSTIPELIAFLPRGVRYVIVYVLVMAIFILGAYGPDMGARLIYMQF